ncbi:helix-turn-helix domain-containing protein [Puia dinghuensis]
MGISEDDKLFLIRLGARIRAVREEIGLKQVELANLLDIERGSMTRIEKGSMNLTSLMLRKICRALKIELEDLFKDMR